MSIFGQGKCLEGQLFEAFGPGWPFERPSAGLGGAVDVSMLFLLRVACGY